jgi:hypothetical protein
MLSEKAAENECADLRKQENSGPIPKNNGGALSHSPGTHTRPKSRRQPGTSKDSEGKN